MENMSYHFYCNMKYAKMQDDLYHMLEKKHIDIK